MDLEERITVLEERIENLERENKQREQEIDELRDNLSNFMYNGDP